MQPTSQRFKEVQCNSFTNALPCYMPWSCPRKPLSLFKQNRVSVNVSNAISDCCLEFAIVIIHVQLTRLILLPNEICSLCNTKSNPMICWYPDPCNSIHICYKQSMLIRGTDNIIAQIMNWPLLLKGPWIANPLLENSSTTCRQCGGKYTYYTA